MIKAKSNLPPDGEYDVLIKSVEERKFKDHGGDYQRIVAEICEGPFAGRRVSCIGNPGKYSVLTGKEIKEGDNFDEEALQGLIIKAKIERRKGKNGSEFANIVCFLPDGN